MTDRISISTIGKVALQLRSPRWRLVFLFSIWALILFLSTASNGKVLISNFEFRPLPSDSITPWSYTSPRNPAPHGEQGFDFRLTLVLDSSRDLSRIVPKVDDSLRKLTINGVEILGGHEEGDGETLRKIFQNALSKYGRVGSNIISGTVGNTGGPTFIKLTRTSGNFFGDRNGRLLAFTTITALLLFLAISNLPRPNRPSLLLTVILITGASLVFFQGFISQLYNYGKDDWDQHLWFVEASRRIIFDFGSLPLWNPYSDGGIPLLGYPQNPSLSPLFFLNQIFGSVAGPKIIVIIHSIIGMVGMFLLLRYTGLVWSASLYGAMLFQFNGAIVHHIGEGHFGHQGFNFIPWSLLFFLRSRYRLNWNLIIAAIFYSFIAYNGSMYEVVYYELPLLVYTILEAVRRRSVHPILGNFYLVTFFLLFSAPKSLAVFDYSSICARIGNSDAAYNVLLFFESMLHPEPMKWYSGQVYFWHEYCSYLNALTLFFFFFGITSKRWSVWPLLCTLGFNVWLTFGNNIQPTLWRALGALPFIGSLLGPVRWDYVTLFVVIVVSSRGVHKFSQAFSRAACFLPCAAFLFQWYALNHIYPEAFSITPPAPWKSGPYRLIQRAPERDDRYSALHEVILGNVGVIDSYNPVAPERFAVGEDRGNYRGLVYVDDGNGTVRQIGWKPDVVTVAVDAQTSVTVVYNQNHFPGWNVTFDSHSQPAIPVHGLVAARVPPGKHLLTFAYRPPLVLAGFIIALSAAIVCLVGAVFCFVRSKRERLLKRRIRHG